MKFSSVLAVLACATTAFSIPFSNPLEERGKTKKAGFKLTSAPSAGGTGIFYDDAEKVTKVFFGDNVKTHAAHLAHHETKFPSHAGKIYKLASGSRDKQGTEYFKNAKDALGDFEGVARNGKVFDEKPWASLSREGDGLVSVVKVPTKESLKEGKLSQLAKQMHKANARSGSQGIKLIDNRTVKDILDPSLIIKGMKRRSIIGSIMNETSSLGDDLKNATSSSLLGDLEDDWTAAQAKMESLIDPLMSDVEWVGDNFIGFLKQDVMPEDHQLGVYWHGMDILDQVWSYDANSTNATDRAWVGNDTNLAYDYASWALHNETSSKLEDALSPYFDALVSLSDEGNDDN